MTEVLVDGARYGDMDDVQSALQSNVDVNATDAMGRTGEMAINAEVAVHAAVLSCHCVCSIAYGSCQ